MHKEQFILASNWISFAPLVTNQSHRTTANTEMHPNNWYTLAECDMCKGQKHPRCWKVGHSAIKLATTVMYIFWDSSLRSKDRCVNGRSVGCIDTGSSWRGAGFGSHYFHINGKFTQIGLNHGWLASHDDIRLRLGDLETLSELDKSIQSAYFHCWDVIKYPFRACNEILKQKCDVTGGFKYFRIWRQPRHLRKSMEEHLKKDKSQEIKEG